MCDSYSSKPKYSVITLECNFSPTPWSLIQSSKDVNSWCLLVRENREVRGEKVKSGNFI